MDDEQSSGAVHGPRTAALSLIRLTALDAARGTDCNQTLVPQVTQILEAWRARGTLHEDSLLMAEWLAVHLCGYLAQQMDEQRLKDYLHTFGQDVQQAQRHTHPAGPVAIELLKAVADDLDADGRTSSGDARLIRMGAAYLPYLRQEHVIRDAREVVLTLGLWAGGQLADVLDDNQSRINAYMDVYAQKDAL